jgi:gluconokinase
MLTGTWVEDYGMASATGLYNVVTGEWDPELLEIAGIQEKQLPSIADRTDIIGRITSRTTQACGLPETAAVVNGSGDGFLANLGSECESPDRICVTLGTSGVARQTLNQGVFDSGAGTFCYRAEASVYLLGCAGSNGGNVLDWARSIFGGAFKDASAGDDVPIFIPLLHGERSPDWNPRLTGSWHELKAKHTAADLSRSVLEGVIFNLAHFVDILQNTSGLRAAQVVLSGNGFLNPRAAPILAAAVDNSVLLPEHPGLASLRGSAVCALRGLGLPVPSLKLKEVAPMTNNRILDRYRRYRSFR